MNDDVCLRRGRSTHIGFRSGNDDFVTTTGFDAVNRPTTIEQSGAGTLPKRIELQYDSANQLINLKRFEELVSPGPVLLLQGGKLSYVSLPGAALRSASFVFGPVGPIASCDDACR